MKLIYFFYLFICAAIYSCKSCMSPERAN